MDEFTKYRLMKDSGASAPVIYNTAKDDGADEIMAIRMLRSVFSLSLVEAKEVIQAADHPHQRLSEQQKGLIRPIEEALKRQNDPD
jgi:ribosomal protein L7/L12